MRVIIALFLTLTSFQIQSQEFGKVFFEISEKSLPTFFDSEITFFVQQHAKVSFDNVSFTEDSHWKAVSLIDALDKENTLVHRKNTMPKSLNFGNFGVNNNSEDKTRVRFQVHSPHSINRNRVFNEVYRDATLIVPGYFYSPYLYPYSRN